MATAYAITALYCKANVSTSKMVVPQRWYNVDVVVRDARAIGYLHAGDINEYPRLWSGPVQRKQFWRASRGQSQCGMAISSVWRRSRWLINLPKWHHGGGGEIWGSTVTLAHGCVINQITQDISLMEQLNTRDLGIKIRRQEKCVSCRTPNQCWMMVSFPLQSTNRSARILSAANWQSLRAPLMCGQNLRANAWVVTQRWYQPVFHRAAKRWLHHDGIDIARANCGPSQHGHKTSGKWPQKGASKQQSWPLMGQNVGELWDPAITTKSEQANNSHGLSWHKMSANYKALFVSDDKKGASQLQLWPFMARDVGKLRGPICFWRQEGSVLGQLALSTLSGLARSRKNRRSNRFLIIEKLWDLVV